MMQDKVKFLTFQAFLKTVQVMSISFFHYFISEEFNLFFFSGIRSQYFVFFIRFVSLLLRLPNST